MDSTKQNINPALLIISNNKNELKNFALKLCKENFCINSKDKNHSCITCNQIEQNQFHNILLLSTESQYKVQDIDIIFEKSSLALEENEKFFFIIEDADLLNIASSNKLLKLVEEPPRGYNFIFLTQRPQDILDTIKSRCIKKILNHTQEIEDPLIKYFTTEKISAPDFIFYLDKSNINEQKTTLLLDEILKFWIKEKNNSEKINLFTNAFQNLPGPGGSKLFWKNLFTKFHQDTKL